MAPWRRSRRRGSRLSSCASSWQLMPRTAVPLISLCPSDRLGRPGALIPASSHAPGRRSGRVRRLAGTLVRSRSGLVVPAHQGRCRSERTERSGDLVASGRCGWLAGPLAGRLHTGAVRPDRLGASACSPRLPQSDCRRPAAAGVVPRSRGSHQRQAALRAPRQGADPGLKSANRARAPGRGAGALSPRHPCGAGPS